MSYDEGRLEELIEESEDIQSDAMRSTRESLDEMVETGHETRARGGQSREETEAFVEDRRRLLSRGVAGGGALAAAGFGAALLAVMEQPAFAAQSTDVQTLQTAASIENLAVATYTTALTLPFIGGSSANPVIKAFVMKTKSQHQQHAQAFNTAATNLGGKAQNKPDPVLLQVVNKAKPGLTSPAPVVALALQLEQGAAETYVANTSALQDQNAKKVTASIMGVEAQHQTVLLAAQVLIQGGAANLIALPPDLAKLPAAAGSVGFPNNFYPTSQARPAAEGAVS